ncbi:MAG: ribosome-associated translation inhibitor RaiA [bacterium]|nr:ribosome-associated translation inhibitor RaiA [bacterium]
MIQLAIKKANIELTPELEEYLEKKIKLLEKLITCKGDVPFEVEIGRTTNHHRKGSIYRAEFQITLPRILLRSESSMEDPREAIDEAHKKIERELIDWKDTIVSNKKRGIV